MTELADIGVVGLGVMGANLSLNLADKGFRVAVYDSDGAKRAAMQDSDAGGFVVCANEEALLAAIRPPRPVILLVPAGEATDSALTSLARLASGGDLLIDAGNADFHDTRRRTAELEARGLSFLGMGVSGGGEGARHGPAIMAGGTRKSWDRVEPMLSRIAAKFRSEPCAGWLGPDGAGHFVKTVHNGIEYADMQMIAEVYGLMRDGAETGDAEIAETFSEWSRGPLASYLVEITAQVAASTDAVSGQPLLGIIADRAGQKGTGRWSIIAAQHLGGRGHDRRSRRCGTEPFCGDQIARGTGNAVWRFGGHREVRSARCAARRKDHRLRTGIRSADAGIGSLWLAAFAGRHCPVVACRMHHPVEHARGRRRCVRGGTRRVPVVSTSVPGPHPAIASRASRNGFRRDAGGHTGPCPLEQSFLYRPALAPARNGKHAARAARLFRPAWLRTHRPGRRRFPRPMGRRKLEHSPVNQIQIDVAKVRRNDALEHVT